MPLFATCTVTPYDGDPFVEVVPVPVTALHRGGCGAREAVSDHFALLDRDVKHCRIHRLEE